jgi:hypothetical protein
VLCCAVLCCTDLCIYAVLLLEQDEHTRAVLTRGGSHYYPVVDAAAHWYYPNTAEMRKVNGPHGKYMLMSDSYDRAGTVGFRCAAD